MDEQDGKPRTAMTETVARRQRRDRAPPAGRRALLRRAAAILPLAAMELVAAPVRLWALGPDGEDCLSEPAGDILLRISGNIARHNHPDGALFDDAMLAELPQVTLRTSTVWTPDVQSFTGPTLHSVLEAVGAAGREIFAEAANNYRVLLDFDMIEPETPILARLIDGQPISRRSRGPLWIIFPFDSDPRYRTELVNAQSVWHLTALVVTGD